MSGVYTKMPKSSSSSSVTVYQCSSQERIFQSVSSSVSWRSISLQKLYMVASTHRSSLGSPCMACTMQDHVLACLKMGSPCSSMGRRDLKMPEMPMFLEHGWYARAPWKVRYSRRNMLGMRVCGKSVVLRDEYVQSCLGISLKTPAWSSPGGAKGSGSASRRSRRASSISESMASMSARASSRTCAELDMTAGRSYWRIQTAQWALSKNRTAHSPQKGWGAPSKRNMAWKPRWAGQKYHVRPSWLASSWTTGLPGMPSAAEKQRPRQAMAREGRMDMRCWPGPEHDDGRLRNT
ncbi:hypothetical protein TOPH_05461 [Tolypocladium ophioglossoides CBS 100239]|uniref:Uncharacterized protein n=1 Tax=Tolypocladium ophioglossoides (strain CBS 100239) TaxID=1163406 RepID=A0A0L0N6W9_TOLOC|nr:hypothetical protein TOPH_05461 [Tolypocladium ophioglossoides CBS 100239]